MQKMDPRYLSPTHIIDSDHPDIMGHAEKTINGSIDPVDMPVAAWKVTYGKDRVPGWVRNVRKAGRDFRL